MSRTPLGTLKNLTLDVYIYTPRSNTIFQLLCFTLKKRNWGPNEASFAVKSVGNKILGKKSSSLFVALGHGGSRYRLSSSLWNTFNCWQCKCHSSLPSFHLYRLYHLSWSITRPQGTPVLGVLLLFQAGKMHKIVFPLGNLGWGWFRLSRMAWCKSKFQK